MNRRKLLSVMGVTLIAGCSDSSDADPSGSTPTSSTETPEPANTPSPTPEPTPTEEETVSTPEPTPEPEPPEILTVNLISDFEDFGDVSDNAIESAPQGETILIGYRHRTWVHDGEFAITTEVRIFDSQGNRVAIDQDQDDQLTEGNGPTEWEGAMVFDATWEPGEYEAEVIIRDDVTRKISEPATGSFQITKPEPKLEVTSSQVYRETYSSGVRGVAKNISDDELSYAEVTVIFLDGDGRQLDSSFDNTSDLAPGREWKFDVGYYGDEEFEDYEIQTDWTA